MSRINEPIQCIESMNRANISNQSDSSTNGIKESKHGIESNRQMTKLFRWWQCGSELSLLGFIAAIIQYSGTEMRLLSPNTNTTNKTMTKTTGALSKGYVGSESSLLGSHEFIRILVRFVARCLSKFCLGG